MAYPSPADEPGVPDVLLAPLYLVAVLVLVPVLLLVSSARELKCLAGILLDTIREEIHGDQG
ncbi:MAG: hypothetical protein ACLUPX_07770 [Atopobiaceae bacterium]